jgi:hypothetical protein
VVILIIIIGGYSIRWPLVIILLVDIGGYSIDDYR